MNLFGKRISLTKPYVKTSNTPPPAARSPKPRVKTSNSPRQAARLPKSRARS